VLPRQSEGTALDRATFEALLGSAPVGAALFDPAGRYLWVNAALAGMNDLQAEAHVGRTLREVLPDEAAEGSQQVLEDVVATQTSIRVESTFAYPEHPHVPRTFLQTWYPVASEGVVTAVAALVWEITDERSAREEAAATTQRLEVALEAGGMGVWDWDLATGRLVWDKRTADIFGIALEDFGATIEAFGELVHPDDAAATSAAIDQAIESRGEFRREYRILRGGEQTRWVSVRGRVFVDRSGEPESMIGVIQDRTETHSQSERLVRTLETMADAFFRLDEDLRFTYVNGRAETMLQRSRTDLLGEHIWEQFPEAVGTPFQEVYERVRDEQVPGSFEAAFEPLGVWVDVGAHPDGGGVAVYFRDITERRRQRESELLLAQRKARAHAAGSRLLDLATAMHGDLSTEEAALAACRAGVAVFGCLRVSLWRVADEGAILLAQHGGNPLPVGMWLPAGDLHGMREVVADGRPQFFSEEAAPASPAELRVASQVGARSFLYAPVELGGTSGVLVAVISFDEVVEVPDGPMLGVAARFVQQTALAIEQARRREAQLESGRLSAQLQSSLLPVPGDLPAGFELGSLYQPGERRLLLGGDFSDVLPRPDGCVAMVIGDVTGHGPEAAAIGAAMRAGWRTLALDGRSPGAVLPVLDRLLRTERTTEEQLVTICCIEVDPDGRTLLVASAGHPPPILSTLGGTDLVDAPVGVLLGLSFEDGGWHEARVPLVEPWSLLLYTDGLPEAREDAASAERVGLEAFAEHVAARDPLGTEDLDGLLRELQVDVRDRAGVPIEDDVALLMLRRRP
jgi:PAS domain S-box-containing protein